LPEDFDLNLVFRDPQAVMSETDKLTNLEKRKALGLNTKSELIMLDRGDITKQEADMKLEEIKQEKESDMQSFVVPVENEEYEEDEEDEDMNGDQGGENEGESEQNI
jgi:hypothetical protein